MVSKLLLLLVNAISTTTNTATTTLYCISRSPWVLLYCIGFRLLPLFFQLHRQRTRIEEHSQLCHEPVNLLANTQVDRLIPYQSLPLYGAHTESITCSSLTVSTTRCCTLGSDNHLYRSLHARTIRAESPFYGYSPIATRHIARTYIQ